jgi:hypothetical protein
MKFQNAFIVPKFIAGEKPGESYVDLSTCFGIVVERQINPERARNAILCKKAARRWDSFFRSRERGDRGVAPLF